MKMNFLQDDNGNNSSSRLGYIAWVVGVLVVWCFVAFTTKNMPEIPDSVLGIVALFLTQKTVQKHIEVTKDVKNENTP